MDLECAHRPAFLVEEDMESDKARLVRLDEVHEFGAPFPSFLQVALLDGVRTDVHERTRHGSPFRLDGFLDQPDGFRPSGGPMR